MKKAAIHNLGCKVNSYEADAMEQMLRDAGYEMVTFGEEPADVYIINTCSVTNIADRKSRQMLHKAKKLNPSAIVIAAGCYVQAEGNNLTEDESVDIIIGNNKKSELINIINDYEIDNEINSAILDIDKSNEYEDLMISSVCEHTRAYIKVQDGCNQFCSYCIIPYTRGRVRSRNPESVMEEVKGLVKKGYKEIVLTGIHLSSYGVDLDGADLLSLIVSLHSVEGLERIRLGSLEPRIITEEFVKVISGLEKVCPHFHLSLQSGCDETLKRMNRRYDTAEYFSKCELLRKYYKKPAITTDVIVGFPGETEEEFEQTRKFLEKVDFYEMHIFKYSRRKGTVADKMKDQVQENIKALRSKILIELGEKMSDDYRRNFMDKDISVLFEEVTEYNGRRYLSGHTREYVKILAEAADESVSLESLINSIVNVHTLEILDNNTMFGII